LVYLGKKIPEYAISNYLAISRNFPDFEVWFIVDQLDNYEKLLVRGVKSWLAPKIEISKAPGRNNYRNGFWVNTTNRFFAMQQFHQTIPYDSILQVEADVIISRQFPMNSFADIRQLIAFPMSSPSIGLASTLWSKDLSATNKLVKFAVEILARNPNFSDTDILGSFAVTTPDEVLVLRSGPDDLTAYRNKVGQDQLSLSGADHKINEKGVFDASTIGIHLCGTDPRNSFGVSRVFNLLEHHFMNLESIDFVIENDEIFLSALNEKRIMYSFHNHSKNKKYFENDGDRKRTSS
jgi:hypothetical protein